MPICAAAAAAADAADVVSTGAPMKGHTYPYSPSMLHRRFDYSRDGGRASVPPITSYMLMRCDTLLQEWKIVAVRTFDLLFVFHRSTF